VVRFHLGAPRKTCQPNLQKTFPSILSTSAKKTVCAICISARTGCRAPCALPGRGRWSCLYPRDDGRAAASPDKSLAAQRVAGWPGRRLAGQVHLPQPAGLPDHRRRDQSTGRIHRPPVFQTAGRSAASRAWSSAAAPTTCCPATDSSICILARRLSTRMRERARSIRCPFIRPAAPLE
jgi:hypothetical protein